MFTLPPGRICLERSFRFTIVLHLQPTPFQTVSFHMHASLSTTSRRSPLYRTGGFSLIEILIALALLAALAGLVIAGFGGVLDKGQEDVARRFVETSLETPLTRYRIDIGTYPTTEQGLQALMKAPSDRASRWRGPYIEREPIDPWGNPYQYRYPGQHNTAKYDIWTVSPDGKEIGNW